jgi:hypothetical protein
VAADQKGARAESAWVVVFDESGISLIPPVRRTWARRGRTPLLPHRCHWKRASMAAALGYHPDGTKARLCFPLQADSYDTDSLIEVLDQLKGFYAATRSCCCGMGCQPTGATRCAPTWISSVPG